MKWCNGPTTYEGCGCFSDTELGISWPCAVHKGVDEVTRQAQRQQEQEELKIEADAWAKWTKTE